MSKGKLIAGVVGVIVLAAIGAVVAVAVNADHTDFLENKE